MLEEIGVGDTEFDGVIHVADRCDVCWNLKFADHFRSVLISYILVRKNDIPVLVQNRLECEWNLF